jgi:hypothetical protein
MAYEKKTKTIPVGAIAADSDALLKALWTLPNAIKITAIRLGVDTDNTKADTNYNTVQVKNGSAVIGAIANGPNSTAGTTIAKGAFGALALTAANCFPAAGDVLTLKVTKTGNGLAYAGAVLEIDYYDYTA